MLIYLVPTTPDNGCLRVLPGSSHHRTPLHEQMPEHAVFHGGGDWARQDPFEQAPVLFSDPAGALDVPMAPCDIVIGDSRLLHAAHANGSDNRRTCIILWYFAGFERLPEGVRASIAGSVPPLELMSPQNRRLFAGRLPEYDGDAAPAVTTRAPGDMLRRFPPERSRL